jgi:hypothetical protein
MLEHPALLIHDWQPAARAEEAPAWIRAITNAARQPLGFVRLAGETGTSWFSWLRKVQLDVFETDDASHLLTVTRSWGMLRAWEVHDADDRHIGIIGKALWTPDREVLGLLDCDSGDHGRILDAAGRQLAQFGKQGRNVLDLTFTPQPTANPFLRMLILASVLTLEPAPH